MRANFRALVAHHIKKSWILMGETVVVLAPDKRRDQEIERRDGKLAIRVRVFDFSSHFACWLYIESITWAKAS